MYVTITIKLVLGLIALLAVTRLLGKKELSQITPFDFIYALVLGGILEESLYDTKVNIGHLLYSLFLWSAMIWFIEIVVQKSDFLRTALKGRPSILINNGELDIKSLKKNHLEMEQLVTMLRLNGIFSIKE
nr:YetF domain-containing protein [Bacillus massiliglaciei]